MRMYPAVVVGAAPLLFVAPAMFAAAPAPMSRTSTSDASSLRARIPVRLAAAGAPAAARPTPAGPAISNPATVTGPASTPASWFLAMGGPERYGVYPGSLDTGQLALNWQYAAPFVQDASLPPVVVAGTVYCAVGTGVYALDVESGAPVWSAPFVPPPPPGQATPRITAAPAYGGDHLFVGSADGVMHVLDARTGKSVQDLTADGPIESSPMIQGNTVVFGTDQGTVYAYTLSPDSLPLLKPLWQRSLAAGDAVAGPIAAKGTTLYANTASGKVFELDEKTGNDLTPANDLTTAIRFGPTPIADGILVESGPRLYDLMPNGLRPRWNLPLAGEISAQPAYANGVLYLVTRNGYIYAYDPAQQKVVWSGSLGVGAAPRAAPVVTGNAVVVGAANGHVYAFAPGGDGQGRARVLWRYVTIPTPEYETDYPGVIPDILAQPVAYGSDLFVLASNGTLNGLSTTAFDNEGPTVEHRYPVGGPYPADPAPSLSAQVRDEGSGLQPGSLKLFIDDSPIPPSRTGLADGSGYAYNQDTQRLTYTPPQPYSDGKHAVRVEAADNRGNSSSVDWTFEVTHKPINYNPPGFGAPGGGPGGAAGAAG